MGSFTVTIVIPSFRPNVRPPASPYISFRRLWIFTSPILFLARLSCSRSSLFSRVACRSASCSSSGPQPLSVIRDVYKRQGEGFAEFKLLQFLCRKHGTHMCGHECIIIQWIIVLISRRQYIGIMAVGTADLGTAGSIQTGAAHRFTLRYRCLLYTSRCV